MKLLNDLTGKKKVTVKQLQVLTGYLNFLTKAIVPGRTFTRRIYVKYTGLDKTKLKPHHHVSVDREFRFDCEIWRMFLQHHRESAVCHPMLDVNRCVTRIPFFSDASGGERLGFGAIYEGHWLYSQWEDNYIQVNKPSIEYLELYAVTAAFLTWGKLIQNQRVLIHCDNKAVVEMLNKSTSSCKNCMDLLRLVIMDNLINNRRVYAEYVKSADNNFADVLSRLQLSRFWSLVEKYGKVVDLTPSPISHLVWTASIIWEK